MEGNGIMDPQPYRQRLEARMTDIAERLVAGEGLAAVQARRIAQEADCSVGTLYNVFGGLDGLIIAVNRRTLAILGDKLGTAARGADGGSAEDRLTALALAYRDFAFGQTSRWRALFEHRMETGKTVPDAYRDEQAMLFTLVESCLDGANDLPAKHQTAARALFAAVHGIVTLALDNKLGAQGAEETESQIRFLVGTTARGMALKR
jgi:AcrR family transcriptional regulator